MNLPKPAYPLVVLSLAAFLVGGCAGKTTTQPPAPAPGVLTMRYADYIDQPNMTTLAELKDSLSVNSPKKTWAWDGGTYTVEHGPNHKLIVTASPQCQELVVDMLLHLAVQDVRDDADRVNWLKLARLRAAKQPPGERGE